MNRLLDYDQVLRELALPMLEKVVFIALLNRCNAEMSCWPSHDTIAKEAGCCARSVRDAIPRLVARGLLSVETRKKPSGINDSNRYRLRIPQKGAEPRVHVAPAASSERVELVSPLSATSPRMSETRPTSAPPAPRVREDRWARGAGVDPLANSSQGNFELQGSRVSGSGEEGRSPRGDVAPAPLPVEERHARLVAETQRDGLFGMTGEAWREGVALSTGGSVSPLSRSDQQDLQRLIEGHAAARRGSDLLAWVRETAKAWASAADRRFGLAPRRCIAWLDAGRPTTDSMPGASANGGRRRHNVQTFRAEDPWLQPGHSSASVSVCADLAALADVEPPQLAEAFDRMPQGATKWLRAK